MLSCARPVLEDPAFRHDGRKAIGSVSARYSRAAAEDQPMRTTRALRAWMEG